MSASCPSKPVLDQVADWARWEVELAAGPGQAESALVARLSQVRDLRRRKGLRHRLVVVLVPAACATLVVGSDSVTAIWQWAAAAPQEKLARLGARWNPLTRRFVVPSERTFRRVLARLDADGLDGAVRGWVGDVARGVAAAPLVPDTPGPVEREQRRAVQRAGEHPVPRGVLPGAAVDGKALRGARTESGPVFLVAAIDHASGAVLGQRQVPSKRGEGVAARDLLTGLDVRPGHHLALARPREPCSSTAQEHQEGRALDYFLASDDPTEKAQGQDLINWLFATDQYGNKHAMARRLGIMYIIWDKQIWGAYRADEGRRPDACNGSRTDCHINHIHFSFSWAGARRQTT